ncbi:UbiH/UbiF/VisC/COQ6 family ubiquinone biosynthesis hydroxylase [Candidatus Nitrosacidococcus tergens]|uniref:Putative oxidoreductase with FAD/NAD(P)-binding domain n=1 Tax=Candidatus Nitrosacidococcus tergens TaxID=553981 RepID=A0A7G1Q7S3_9GAMM|nr:UbiH/UbiF/VisC/COQ6 family ubiquinone biosynthesis hydroxylase [Candidatus Nitrosacidococcus tergens]CAB1274538.1 putative oxidoreductase with FAD/NAD(P)-binding domain [Candidatus Nitrosacidococcus tergens]
MNFRSSATHYDVLIVGAGMVGACLALALSQSEKKYRIALIEAHPPELNTLLSEDYDLRVSAITRASENIFRNIHVWRNIEAKRVSPFRKMHVWNKARIGEIHFDSTEISESHLGHIIENKLIQNTLLEACKNQENIDFYMPGNLQGIIQKDEKISLQLEEGSFLKGSLIVGADGAQSKVRDLAGISIQIKDYQQNGLVGTIHTEKPHDETAWQRFLPSGGILAFLPLKNPYQCSIVWSTDSEEAEQLKQLSNSSFATALGSAFEYRLGATQIISERATFPLRRQQVKTYVQPRIALIGDAAHTIHPLAGQGVNLGLLDAVVLAQVLNDQKNKDVGDFLTLRRFERWRKGDSFTAQLTIDGLKHLFNSSLFPIQIARNLGLSATDKATPIKNLILCYASGLKGDLPILAQGRF